MKLIDAIKIQAQCQQESELKYLPADKKNRIANLIEERVSAGLATIDEWNEAILCFADESAETDNEQAKNKLLSILRAELEVK